MNRRMFIAALAAAGCAAFNGCDRESGSGGSSGGHDDVRTNTPASFLAVGMERSARFGACPGCKVDAENLSILMRSELGYSGTTLVSTQATKANVAGLLRKGIEETPENGLFLFFYSGHGGQEHLGGKEPDGADAPDEFLCLYDTYMLDDEIWDIVSKCRGRVFMYFDACHSATMYRSVLFDIKSSVMNGGKPPAEAAEKAGVALAVPSSALETTKGFSFDPTKFAKAYAMDASGPGTSPRIMCWSGCKESEYSYGGDNGGVMTRAVMRNWKRGCSYSLLWGRVSTAVQKEQPTQHPASTWIGDWPTMAEAFK